jgi:hypothetical protein
VTTAQTADLAAEVAQWLRAQLNEDERIARAVQWDGSGNRLSWELSASATIDVGEDEFYAGDRTIANHAVEHDPARVLREIDAKRQVLRDLEDAEASLKAAGPGTPPHDLMTGATNTLRRMVRVLAEPYAPYRPGYKEEWRP